MPAKACPYIKRAAELVIENPHWEKSKAVRRGLEMSNLPNMMNLSKGEIRSKLQLVRRMVSRMRIKIERDQEKLVMANDNAEKETKKSSPPVQDDDDDPCGGTSVSASPPKTNETNDNDASASALAANKKPNQKKTRRSKSQWLNDASKRLHQYDQRERAYAEAIQMWKIEKSKGKEKGGLGLSVRQVAKIVSERYNVAVSHMTLLQKVKDGVNRIHVQGPRGKYFTPEQYNVLKSAFSSAVSLERVMEGKQGTEAYGCERRVRTGITKETDRNRWTRQLYHVLGSRAAGRSASAGVSMYNRLIRDTFHVMNNTDEEYFMELRRRRKSFDLNLNCWYDNWKKFMIQYGFASDEMEYDNEGKFISEITFRKEQKRRVIHLDEYVVGFDGSASMKNRRPTAIRTTTSDASATCKGTGTVTHKKNDASVASVTVFAAHNASGEALPLHIHLPFEMTDEISRILGLVRGFSGILGLPKGFGKFGMDKFRGDLPVTFAWVNKKGGMNSDPFQDYVEKNILPLYPDARDTPGKRVSIHCYGGPDRLDWITLRLLRQRGFYIYPSIPDGTDITQELHHVSSDSFQSMVRRNSEALMNERSVAGQCGTITIKDLGVMLNGRQGSVDKAGLPSPFLAAFSMEKNLDAWEKAGVIPLTRNALNQKFAGRVSYPAESAINIPKPEDLPITNDLFHIYVQQATLSRDLAILEVVNKASVDFLCKEGFNANVLRRTAPKATTNQINGQIDTDQPHSKCTQSHMFVSTGASARPFYRDIDPNSGAERKRKQNEEKKQSSLTVQAEAFKRHKKSDEDPEEIYTELLEIAVPPVEDVMKESKKQEIEDAALLESLSKMKPEHLDSLYLKVKQLKAENGKYCGGAELKAGQEGKEVQGESVEFSASVQL